MTDGKHASEANHRVYVAGNAYDKIALCFTKHAFLKRRGNLFDDRRRAIVYKSTKNLLDDIEMIAIQR